MFVEELPHPFSVSKEVARFSIAAVCAYVCLYGCLKALDDQLEFSSNSFGLRGLAIALLGEEIMMAAQVDMLVCQVPFGD